MEPCVLAKNWFGKNCSRNGWTHTRTLKKKHCAHTHTHTHPLKCWRVFLPIYTGAFLLLFFCPSNSMLLYMNLLRVPGDWRNATPSPWARRQRGVSHHGSRLRHISLACQVVLRHISWYGLLLRTSTVVMSHSLSLPATCCCCCCVCLFVVVFLYCLHCWCYYCHWLWLVSPWCFPVFSFFFFLSFF